MISYKIVTIINVDILKLEKPQFVIFFQEIFIKTQPQNLKNLKKQVFASLQMKDFFLILLVIILRLISLKKIYLGVDQN